MRDREEMVEACAGALTLWGVPRQIGRRVVRENMERADREKAGKVVMVTSADSVRIETTNGLGVSIPADFILAVDRVLNATRESGNRLSIEHVCEKRGEWCATAASEQGFGATPWGAIVGLGEALKRVGT